MRLGRFPRFLIGSALVIGAVAALTGLLAGDLVERQLEAALSEHTTTLVINEARRHLARTAFDGGPSGATTATFESLLRELPGIFRIKVFDTGGRILWSDKPELIGRAFPDNAPFRRALGGQSVAVIGQPKQAEHLYERSHAYIVEVYVPVTFEDGGRVAGVIEAYRDGGALVADIRTMQRRIWLLTGAGGVIAFVALGAIAWRASRAEWRALSRLESENREISAIQRYTQSILQQVDMAAVATAIAESAVRDVGLHRAMLYRVAADRSLSLLAHSGTPGPPGSATSKEAPVEALTTNRCVVRGATAAMPVTVRGGGRYLFIGDFTPASGPDAPALRVLDIMMEEARLALAHAELFAEVSEAREQLAAVLSGVTDHMVILDRRMRVMWTNQPGGTVFIGAPCADALGGDACTDCPGAMAFLSARPARGRRVVPGPDGGARHLDIIAAPLPDGGGYVRRVLEVARDITGMVEMEERLKESSARLEAANTALVLKAIELETKNGELVALQAELAGRERRAAVVDVTVGLHHAILNPLAGILGALDVLEHGEHDETVRALVFTELRLALRKIEQSVRRLSTLRDAGGTPYVGATTMIDLEAPDAASAAQATADG